MVRMLGGPTLATCGSLGRTPPQSKFIKIDFNACVTLPRQTTHPNGKNAHCSQADFSQIDRRMTEDQPLTLED